MRGLCETYVVRESYDFLELNEKLVKKNKKEYKR